MYMRQLDSLRCIAVSLVVFVHYTNSTYNHFSTFGVRLFFVLSGFLITGILLEKPSLNTFYARRFLRIFPLYYATLIIAYIFGDPGVRAGIQWHATYLTNIYLGFVPDAVSGNAGHFWSLAVEEQFYLFWPLVVLTLPRRWLGVVILAMIVVAPIYRWGMISADFGMTAATKSTPACLDSLGVGAALALWRNKSTRAYGLLGLAIMLTVYFGYHRRSDMRVIWFDTGAALFSVWLIQLGAQGKLKFLEFEPMMYLGRISYGIYVIHLFFRGLHPAIAVTATIGLAALSFQLWETPWNNLKERFPYKRKTAMEPDPPRPTVPDAA